MILQSHPVGKETATLTYVHNPKKDPLLVCIDRCQAEISLELWPSDKYCKKLIRGNSSVEIPALNDNGPLLAQSHSGPLSVPTGATDKKN